MMAWFIVGNLLITTGAIVGFRIATIRFPRDKHIKKQWEEVERRTAAMRRVTRTKEDRISPEDDWDTWRAW